jgi:cell division GTPase FtsZ
MGKKDSHWGKLHFQVLHMTINLTVPSLAELKPRITVFGVGGGGGNAVNNMINAGLRGVDFVVANTDAQALTMSKSERMIQLGAAVTEGLGAGSQPEVGRAAAEECIDEIVDHLNGAHMCFITAGMGGGTGTGAAPVMARAAKSTRHPHRWRGDQALPLRRRAPHEDGGVRHRAPCRRTSIR